MGGVVLGEDDGQEVLDDGGEGEHAPEFEDLADELGVAGAQVLESVEDGDVEGEHLAEWRQGYLAKNSSEDRNRIILRD